MLRISAGLLEINPGYDRRQPGFLLESLWSGVLLGGLHACLLCVKYLAIVAFVRATLCVKKEWGRIGFW